MKNKAYIIPLIYVVSFTSLLVSPLTHCWAYPNAAELKTRPLTQQVAFSGELTPDNMQAVANACYKSVINNRPDHEDPNQPTSADIAAAAVNSGLSYANTPIVKGAMTDKNIQDVADAFNSLPKPILMFCKSGRRAESAYHAAVERGLIIK